MTRVKLNGHEYVLSRERNGIVELVSVETGELVGTPGEGLVELPSFDTQVVPGAVSFELRAKSFLSELRAKRLEVLVQSRKAKARERTRASKAPRSKKKSDLEILKERFERERRESREGTLPSPGPGQQVSPGAV